MSNQPPIYKSLNFITLLVGLVMFVVTFFVPAFPLSQANVLELVLFALGLIGIYPQFKLNGFRGALAGDILNSLPFWQLVVGLVSFVISYYFPNFPLGSDYLLPLFLFVLGLFGIVPTVAQLGMRGALAGGIVNVLAFWQLVAGFIWFVIAYYAPTFPFSTETILGVILFVLQWFQIKPELQARAA